MNYLGAIKSRQTIVYNGYIIWRGPNNTSLQG